MRELKKILKRSWIRIKNNRHIKLMAGSNLTITSFFEGHNYVGFGSAFDGYMGYGSYIGDNSSVSGKIGKYSCIASAVTVVNGFHPTEKVLSVHPAFYNPDNSVKLHYLTQKDFNERRYADEGNHYSVIIGNDVWIGYGALIIAGIKIGDGAVIAAGSVVTKDVKPYTIVGGSPARLIRKRFDDQTVEALLADPWWEKSETWISENAWLFKDAKNYIKHNYSND